MRHIILALTIFLTLLSPVLAELTFCSPCKGSGKCHVCEGDGKRSDGSQCSWCSGSKKCYYCSGAGKY